MMTVSTKYVHLDVAKTVAMMGDETVVPEILQMAQQTLSEQIQQILKLMGSGDLTAAGQVLHTVKGSLPIFGGDSLVERVTLLEKSSKMGAGPELAPLFVAIVSDLERLVLEIQEYLSK